MNIERFKKKPILGILRGIGPEHVEGLAETAALSGLEALEITMNTSGAAELIRKMAAFSKNRFCVGAGTVLNMKSLKLALDSGATFIVTPVLVEDVVGYCVKHDIPVFPGALTPLEIYNAWNAGATMVKVFPSSVFGTGYFRELKGPFNDISLLACGGVTPENMNEYFSNGASAVAFGANVFKKEWLAKKDFKSIGESIKRYTNALKEAL